MIWHADPHYVCPLHLLYYLTSYSGVFFTHMFPVTDRGPKTISRDNSVLTSDSLMEHSLIITLSLCYVGNLFIHLRVVSILQGPSLKKIIFRF